jgi:hypothetical protein
MPSDCSMTRRAFLDALKLLEMRQIDFAAMFDISPRQVSRWGRKRPNGDVHSPFPGWVGPAVEHMLLYKILSYLVQRP